MRLLHIAAQDINGGAFLAAYRLHRAIRKLGCDSRMLVSRKLSSDESVIGLRPPQHASIPRRIANRLACARINGQAGRYAANRPDYAERFVDDRTPRTRELLRHLPDADVYLLHWTAGVLDYARFFGHAAKHRLQLAWRLADMSPLTGGCAYSWDCRHFEEACGTCPQLGSTKESDLSHAIFERKRRALSRLTNDQLHIIALNKWMANHKKRSPLFQRFRHSIIPNGVDQNFQPIDRSRAREILDIGTERRVIAFVADATHIRRKGLNLLLTSLTALESKANLTLLVVGARSALGDLDIDSRQYGYVQQEEFLSLIYSAADLFVIPSLEDNQPNTVLEAMACGLPVVAFDTGGIPEMVQDDVNGRLVTRGDTTAFTSAIQDILESAGLRKRLSEAALDAVSHRYSREHQAKAYLTTLEGLLQ